MHIKNNNSEKGQAIVYLVVGLVVFLGFVALAIDGGMALADRRHSQNAADAASLAGGAEAALTLESHHINYSNWDCGNGTPVQLAITNADNTAISRAAANSFSIDTNLNDHNGVVAACGSTNLGYFIDKYIDVTVEISATTKSNFLQLLFPKALHNEVEAVTRVRPRQPMVFGNAIVALNPDNSCGPQSDFGVHGTADLLVSNGGIFSNGCIYNNGNATAIVNGGSIYGHTLSCGNCSPPPIQTSFIIPSSAYDLPTPDCSNPAAHQISGDLPANMTAGLYCVTGGLTLHGTYIGTGVTIVILSGDVKMNGNADLEISAPMSSSPDPYPAIQGLVLYIPPSNPTTFRMNGHSYAKFVGTVLAPTSSISLLGTNDTSSYQAQIIGWNVDFGGTAQAYVSYDGAQQYTRPTAIELAK
jgi:hypothetical protein